MKRSASLLLFAFASIAMPAGQQIPEENAVRILKLFRDEFIALTPGQGKHPKSFVMGTAKGSSEEQPSRTITLAYPFSMAKYEVTQELYGLVMGTNPSKWRGPRNSAEKMTWKEANDFCSKVTVMMQQRKFIAEDEDIRLPSEAEWEYVCRAGTATAYSFGDDVNELTHYCWYKGNSKGHDPPVGMKKPNPWGFYDMHGYIWEWCADGWHANYEGAPHDGSPRKGDGKAYVIRGGSWTHPAEMCRSASRVGAPADTKSDAVGFRCVLAKKKGIGNGR